MKKEIKVVDDKTKLLHKAATIRQKIADEALEMEKEKSELEKRINEIREEVEKKVHEVNRWIDKTRPIIEEYKEDLKLKEFEVISKVFVEDDKLYMEINDEIDMYKAYLRAEKKKEKEKVEKEEKQVEEEPKKALKKHENS